MRLMPILAFALVAGCATDPLHGFDNRGAIGGDGEMFAFVGEKIGVAMLVDEGADDPNVVVLDLAYAARYRIIDVVHGKYDKEFVDFVAYDHYGYPAFAKRDVALVYLVEADGALYHRKYQYDDVYPTADGRYAGCGDPYAELEEDDAVERRALESVDFDPPVVMKISEHYVPADRRADYTPEEIEEDKRSIDAFFSPPVFDVKGDLATCRMGARPDELFRIRNETVFLPQRRFELCGEKLNINIYQYRQEDRAALDACVDEMKAQGL